MTNAQLSPNAQLRLSPRALVSLLGHLTGAFPNPDDPGPVGPWGPIIRQASGQVRWRPGPQPEPSMWSALNPQPLPPHYRLQLKAGGQYLDAVNCTAKLGLNPGSTYADGACQLWRLVPESVGIN